MRKTTVLPVLLVALASAGVAGTSYSLPGSSMDNESTPLPVSASVILSLSVVGSTEVLTVIVDNNEVNQKSDGQNITGVELNFNSSQITGATLASSSGNLIDLDSSGNVTSLGTGSLSHWANSTSLSDLIFTTIGSGQPKDAIIGKSNSSGVYSNANASLTGGPKQPYAQDTATFTFDLTGTNISLSSFTGAEIGFGTAGNDYTNATVIANIAAPEPDTVWFGMIAVLTMCLAARRKRLNGAFAAKN